MRRASLHAAFGRRTTRGDTTVLSRLAVHHEGTTRAPATPLAMLPQFLAGIRPHPHPPARISRLMYELQEMLKESHPA